MKIIAGKFKGRAIRCLQGKNIRPTSSKVREAMFNIILGGRALNKDGENFLENAVIADIFCGTAAFALEALSRGARKAIAVDIEYKHLKLVEFNADFFNLEPGTLTTLRADALSLPVAPLACDMVFIDPPYDLPSIESCLAGLVKQNWLQDEALIIIESHKRTDWIIPSDFQIIDIRPYGNTKIILLKFQR